MRARLATPWLLKLTRWSTSSFLSQTSSLGHEWYRRSFSCPKRSLMLSRILQPLPSGSKLNSHQTPINSVSSRRRKWRAGSPNGKGFTIIGNSVIDCSGLKPNVFTLLAKIARLSHNVTGEVTVEVGVLERDMGWQDRWTARLRAICLPCATRCQSDPSPFTCLHDLPLSRI